MSVLSYPRIYFRGFMEWDPATGNNNDYFPTFDDVQSALNWPFLEKHTPVTRENYRETFVPWGIREQTIYFEVPNLDGSSAWAQEPPFPISGIPMEWNYFGGNAAAFVQYQDKTTRITGGALEPRKGVSGDPLIGKPAAVVGNPFGNPDAPTPGRLVDGNPVSVYTSQIYFKELRFGDGDAGLVAPRSYRMQSRFINFSRNYNLGAAGGASVTWQTCFPKGEGLEITPGSSKLLAALAEALEAPGVQGVMVRFNAYLNLYSQNGYFNGISPSPANKNADMTRFYEQVERGEIEPFSNPCYSRIVGVIGVWNEGELATVPGGRYLVPKAALLTPEEGHGDRKSLAEGRPSVSFAAVMDDDPGVVAQKPEPKSEDPGIRIPPKSPKASAALGAALVEVDYDTHTLRLDLMNTFPEVYWQGTKAGFGPVEVGVLDGSNAFTQVAELKPGDYDEAAYEATCGLVDLSFDPQHADAIRQGTLAFRASHGVRTDPPDQKVVLQEVPLTAQSDRRSDYLDQKGKLSKGTLSIPVGLRLKGQAAPGAKVLVARYNPPDALFGYGTNGGSQGSARVIEKGADQIVTITTGEKKTVKIPPIDPGGKPIEIEVNVVTADDQGNLTLEVEAANPGFPILGLFPFLADEKEPPLPAAYSDIGTGFFATLRVLPFDNDMVGEFVDFWNSIYRDQDAPEKAWNYIYDNVLYVYDLLYPVMRRFLPLGDRTRVEGGIDQVLALVSERYFHESTLAMPITRDLSAGKRKVLELWGNLVRRKYPQEPISKP